MAWAGLNKYWSQAVRNNLSCSSSILAAGCELDRSEQSRQGGPGMDWVSPERQRRVLGSGVTLWGGPTSWTSTFRKSPSKNYLKSSILGGCVRGGSTIIHWSLRFGIQSKQDSLRWVRTKYWKYKTCFGAFDMDTGSKLAFYRLLSTIDCSFIFYHRWGSKYWSICSHHKYHICHHCSEGLRLLRNA